MKNKSLEILKHCLNRDSGEPNSTLERMASVAEGELVFKVVQRCAELYLDDVNLLENKEKRHKLTLDFFEKEVAKLGVNAEVKEFLYCTCLLGVALQSDLLGYEKFLGALLDKYPLYSIYKIFKFFENGYEEEAKYLDSHKFQNNVFMDIEHIIFVDNALDLVGGCFRFWGKLEAIYSLIDKADLLPLECNFRSVNLKCNQVLGKSFEHLESLFCKNNTIWLAIQCLFSGAYSEEDIKPYFSFHIFFAAKAFILIFKQITPLTLDKLFSLNCFQQRTCLAHTLMHNPYLDELARQYLDAVFENFRG